MICHTVSCLIFSLLLMALASVIRFGNFYYQIRLDALRHPPPLLYILQCLEQEGVVRPNLSSCGNKICIYGHTGFSPLDRAFIMKNYSCILKGR